MNVIFQYLMLQDLGLIVELYLKHTTFDTFDEKQLVMIHYLYKRYGDGYEYNKLGKLVGRWMFDPLEMHTIGASITWDDSGDLIRVYTFDTSGYLEKEENYRNNVLLFEKINFQDGTVREIYYTNRKVHMIYEYNQITGEYIRTTTYDDNGKIVSVGRLNPRCCIIS